MTEEQWSTLVRAACDVRLRAYAKYSNFLVGAALQAKGGPVFSGCNVENISYGLTNCAERTAVFSAVAAGFREFDGIVIATAGGVSPCGACRQVLHEFSPEMWVYFHDDDGGIVRKRVNALLSNGFRLHARGGKR
jgi:cytidine deaminase